MTETTAQQWLNDLEAATAKADPAAAGEAAAALFEPEGFWRDLTAMTWNLYTAEGREEIARMVAATHPNSTITNTKLTEVVDEGEGVTRIQFTCETGNFSCRGIARLRNGKAWTLLISGRELKDFPERRGRNRELGAQHGPKQDPENWADRREKRRATLGITEQPYVLIIGGGQGGIALGARLKRQGVPALIVDKADRPGDQWRGRYHSLCLHDPVWYDHMPYLPFPDDWPVFTPKDKMGDWLEHYVGIMDLDYWTNAEVTHAKFDEDNKRWNVTLTRDGNELTLHPTQLVFATGMSGVPNRPQLKGQENFKGEIRHSSEHPGGEGDRDKDVVILGANNSAHDIAADLVHNGARPVMIQRSSTHVSQSDSLMKHVFGPLYSEDAVEAGIDTDTADLLFASWPTGCCLMRSGRRSIRSARRTPSSTRRSPTAGSWWTSATTTPASSSSICAAAPATTSTSVPRSWSPTAPSPSTPRLRSPRSRSTRSCLTTAPSCPPTSSCSLPATAR